jgi:hypothetical protein
MKSKLRIALEMVNDKMFPTPISFILMLNGILFAYMLPNAKAVSTECMAIVAFMSIYCLVEWEARCK